MATRSIVAYPTETGFEGCYIHWDGYPSGVGREIYLLFNQLGAKDFRAFIERNPDGFSAFPREPYSKDLSTSKAFVLNDKEAVACGCEYAYVIKENTMNVYSAYSGDGSKMIGAFGRGDEKAHWNLVTIVDMTKPAPDWVAIDNVATVSLSLS